MWNTSFDLKIHFIKNRPFYHFLAIPDPRHTLKTINDNNNTQRRPPDVYTAIYQFTVEIIQQITTFTCLPFQMAHCTKLPCCSQLPCKVAPVASLPWRRTLTPWRLSVCHHCRRHRRRGASECHCHIVLSTAMATNVNMNSSRDGHKMELDNHNKLCSWPVSLR